MLLIIFKVLKKNEWERGGRCSPCRSKQKLLLALLQKKHLVENNNNEKGHWNKLVSMLSEVGAMVYACKDAKTHSVHLLLCLLLLKIPSLRLKTRYLAAAKSEI